MCTTKMSETSSVLMTISLILISVVLDVENQKILLYFRALTRIFTSFNVLQL